MFWGTQTGPGRGCVNRDFLRHTTLGIKASFSLSQATGTSQCRCLTLAHVILQDSDTWIGMCLGTAACGTASLSCNFISSNALSFGVFPCVTFSPVGPFNQRCPGSLYLITCVVQALLRLVLMALHPACNPGI